MLVRPLIWCSLWPSPSLPGVHQRGVAVDHLCALVLLHGLGQLWLGTQTVHGNQLHCVRDSVVLGQYLLHHSQASQRLYSTTNSLATKGVLENLPQVETTQKTRNRGGSKESPGNQRDVQTQRVGVERTRNTHRRTGRLAQVLSKEDQVPVGCFGHYGRRNSKTTVWERAEQCSF